MQIFVVDSNDKDRVGEAHDELHRMLSEDELREAVVLVFANKQDLPNAMSVAEVSARSLARSLARYTPSIPCVRMCFSLVGAHPQLTISLCRHAVPFDRIWMSLFR